MRDPVNSHKYQGRIAVSAVALVSGGTFVILNQAIAAAATLPDWRFYFLVHDHVKLGLPKHQNITYVDFPDANRSYLRRLYTEYARFKSLSQQWQIDIWLSLHDTTPNVDAKIQAVYCHNPLPYWQPTLRDVWYHAFEVFRAYTYGCIYRWRASANRYVIAQQYWFANFLASYMRLPQSRVLVVAPANETIKLPERKDPPPAHKRLTCFYPALPRVFKNFEEAIDLVSGTDAFLTLTLSGDENKYARHIRQIAPRDQVEFVGLQTHQRCLEIMRDSDVLLFPSRLETFGLPIAEAIQLKRRLVLPVTPWALEIAGDYTDAYFYRNLAEGKEIVRALSNHKQPKRLPIPSASTASGGHVPMRGFHALYSTLIAALVKP